MVFNTIHAFTPFMCNTGTRCAQKIKTISQAKILIPTSEKTKRFYSINVTPETPFTNETHGQSDQVSQAQQETLWLQYQASYLYTRMGNSN